MFGGATAVVGLVGTIQLHALELDASAAGGDLDRLIWPERDALVLEVGGDGGHGRVVEHHDLCRVPGSVESAGLASEGGRGVPSIANAPDASCVPIS
jgi:hypothetical protein